MSHSIRVIQNHLARLRTLVLPSDDLRAFVCQALDDQIAAVTSDTPMGIVPPSVLSETQLLASARMAAELVDEPARLAAKPEGIVDLGVIEWLLRPALQLKSDVFEPAESGPWKNLASDTVERQAHAVCRLDVSIDDSSSVHVGTGFVAGEDAEERFVVVTNAHVVDEVVRLGWPGNKRITFGCDFSRFSVNNGGNLCALELEYKLHPVYDMALLHVRSDSAYLVEDCQPLSIAPTAPRETDELRIGVVGHPAFDSRRDPFPRFFGFGNEFGVKRFSPGFVRAHDERVWRGSSVHVILHDATTLSGSSGSCVLDLETMNVVGLHFGGWPIRENKTTTPSGDILAALFESNGAVPMWMLAQDPFCADLSFC